MLQKFKIFTQFDKVPGSFETNWLLNDFIARRLKKDSVDANKEQEDSTKKNGSSTVKKRKGAGAAAE